LKRTVEKSEMLEVVRDLDGDKALGPNGLSLAFFQKCWEVFFLYKKKKKKKKRKRTLWMFSRSFVADGSLRRALMQLLFSLSLKKPMLWTLRTFVLLVG
jgi:hypothetical protein